nr:9331_t:CDS:10 [Entrophospora candida]
MRYELKINGINIRTLLETYQDVSLEIGKEKQLLVESNTYEILSLSYILLLIPKELHLQQTLILPKIILGDKPVYTFRKAIKMGKNDSRDVAVDWLCVKLLKEKIIKDNLGLFHDPDKTLVQWPNTELHESKIRNLASRAKQPDFTVSLIHQQQIDSVIFVGEVSPPSERNNVFKNSNDLIWLSTFMKDCMDSSIAKGADIEILGFQCIEYTVDFYVMDLAGRATCTMSHLGQIKIPADFKDIYSFVDDIGLLLGIKDIFTRSFNNFYEKLHVPSRLEIKPTLKEKTLSTQEFGQLVSKTRDRKRSCPLWFGKHSIFSNETNFSPINSHSKLFSECNDIYKQPNKCAFVREYCANPSSLVNYLKYYFCDLQNWQFFALTTLFLWLLFLFGFIGIAASDFFCPNLYTIASKLSLSESMAGVTFLAFGNGSPDVFSTFSAVTHGYGSLAIGELLGAASFITFVVAGTMAVITPFHVTRLPFLRDLIFFTGAISFTFMIIYDGEIHLWEGIVLVSFYFTYVGAVLFVAWYEKNEKNENEVFEPLLSDNRTDNISSRETYIDQESQRSLTPIEFHQNKSGRSTRSIHRGVRPSLLGAIEFRDDVNAGRFRLPTRHHNEYYNRRPNRQMRSTTMPSYSSINDNPRRKPWSSFAGPVNQSLVDDDLNTPQINISAPTLAKIDGSSSSSLTSNLNITNSQDSGLNNNNDNDGNRDNETINNLNVPHLMVTSSLSNKGAALSPESSIRSSPLSLSPKALPVNDTAPVSPLFLESRYGTTCTSPSAPPSFPHVTNDESTWLTKVQETLFPSVTGFSQKSFFAKLTSLMAIPAILLLTLTLPVVETNDPISENENKNENNLERPSIVIDNDANTGIRDVKEEERTDGWNKWLTSIQFLFAPIFISSVLFADDDSIVTTVSYAFIFGLASSIFCFLFTDKNKPPKFYSLLCFMGFVVAMVWVFLIANEVVGLLQAVGLIIEVSDAILGLTIFAMGNSLGDFVANITTAKMGSPMMAISACFGGPMLNILFGIGISATYTTITTGHSTKINIDINLLVSVFGLLIGLCSALIYLPYNGYHMTRPWGYYLISIYVVCMITNLIIEFNSMHSTPADIALV